jgi:NADPH:quinone reductase-like Zn-dependent oxidoreductase
MGGLNEFQPDIAQENVDALVKLADEGKLNPLVSASLPLSEASKALQMLIDRDAIGKVILT